VGLPLSIEWDQHLPCHDAHIWFENMQVAKPAVKIVELFDCKLRNMTHLPSYMTEIVKCLCRL